MFAKRGCRRIHGAAGPRGSPKLLSWRAATDAMAGQGVSSAVCVDCSQPQETGHQSSSSRTRAFRSTPQDPLNDRRMRLLPLNRMCDPTFRMWERVTRPNGTRRHSVNIRADTNAERPVAKRSRNTLMVSDGLQVMGDGNGQGTAVAGPRHSWSRWRRAPFSLHPLVACKSCCATD